MYNASVRSGAVMKNRQSEPKAQRQQTRRKTEQERCYHYHIMA